MRYVKDGHVARVTIDRPEVLNAMDLRTHAELAEVWDDVQADDRIRLAVLTGAGDRAFSVGQDLHERARLDAEGGPRTSFGSRGLPGHPRLTERFGLVKPVIARVDGYALGGGFELALACDLVIASDRAVFALPEAGLGLMPGAGGVFRLVRQLPLKTAMGHLLTGRRMDAAAALRFGLVNEVVPAEELDARTEAWVRDVLRCAPLSLYAIKEAALASLDLPLAEAFGTRFTWEERRRRSRDAVEGPRAFAEGREPRWAGLSADSPAQHPGAGAPEV
ncbi:enoyl-CoA-hydratase DpgD [Kitasatospora sp. NPDC048545]|uniref:enoyl-CoA-hydratase DpgD n=1 Tax=Kitasatospora sp. NPDC048545 TaxID=3157208 RepID=UPI0033C2C9A3